jgi:hypothetical protein
MPHPRPRRSRQLNGLPGDPLDARQASSQAEALSQIDDRNVYGAYEAATNRLFVASAANRATAIALEATFDRAAAAQGGPAVRVTDVKPLLPKDSNGTAVFYSMIAWVFGGYIRMSKPAPLARRKAFRVGLELIAAWPCPPSPGPRRGWPSPEWKERYRALRTGLISGPAPPAAEVTAALFELQRQLRDASEALKPPPDIASTWEESFAALSRASALIEDE